MKTIRVLPAAIAIFLLFVPASFAHHLWIGQAGDDKDTWAVIRGIVPDRIDPYDPDRIREILAVGVDGRPVDIERMESDDIMKFRAENELSMAAAWSAWGYRVNTTRGKRLIGRAEAEDEGLRILSAFHSTHYAKSLFSWTDAAGEPAGLRFEIIPRQNPMEAGPGSEIRFKVLFDGKPLAGTPLYTENGEEATTNDDGVAAVTIPDGPTALLYARHRIDVEGDEKKDYDIFTTFLTFKVHR